MLQQTQAGTVAERFGRFLRRFPNAEEMAAAPEADVLVAWSGLGYNRRALALRRAAAAISTAGWPREVDGLARLPGIGPYTARAVASLACGVQVGVVDTNVRRWLIRRFGLDSDSTPATLQRVADALAGADALDGQADAWTHASMEFGAAICRSRRPRCEECPIARGCPSRGLTRAVTVPRQPRFVGSQRAARGTVLRRLSLATGHRLSLRTLRRELSWLPPGISHDAAERAIESLERDALVHRTAGILHLGSARVEREGTAVIPTTIGG
jgi:A/G-specific adenine glycosylase